MIKFIVGSLLVCSILCFAEAIVQLIILVTRRDK